MNGVMNGVMNKERGKEKENPPAPPKGKESQKENLPDPNPDNTRTHARTREGNGPGPVPGPAQAAYSPGPGPGGFRRFNGPGPASRRTKIDARFILSGDMGDGRRSDPIQTAMIALGIPEASCSEDGLTRYNNARIMRYYLRGIGERAFRELVYQQWRENVIDGLPRSTVAAFMDKLYIAFHGTPGVKRHAKVSVQA